MTEYTPALLRKDLAHSISLWEKTAAERDRLREVNADLLAALMFARRIMASGDPITDDVLGPIDAAISRAKGE